ncbi:MAG: hypothetical protein K6B69_00845 [Lachnospiraceae bacterium]|nr:hypothetical protein [Lachnospiraceae bacterium]
MGVFQDINIQTLFALNQMTAMCVDDDYDRARQKYFDTIIRSLKDTLEEYDIADIFEADKGQMRIVPEKIDCDLYRYLQKDRTAIESFRGEYMSSYAWGRIMEGYLTDCKK